jgi:hypothetical protein
MKRWDMNMKRNWNWLGRAFLCALLATVQAPPPETPWTVFVDSC